MNLPDLVIHGGRHKLIDRVLVSYPAAETEAEKKARIAKGEPQPTISYVVSTIVRNTDDHPPS